MSADVTEAYAEPVYSARRQMMVDAPLESVWRLIGDPNRHPEWWPRVEEVQCSLLEEGSTYRQVTKRPLRKIETDISIERLEDLHELRIRCVDTGMYAEFLLAPAQNGTFVDAKLGVEEHGLSRLATGPFVRRWITQSLDGLRRAATSAAGAGQQPGDEGRERATA
jgi:uncharacterized protein YndB with AHSA1/START domain